MRFKNLRTLNIGLGFLLAHLINPISPSYAVTDEQFEDLKQSFLKLRADMGILSQASYELPIGSIIAWSGGKDIPLPEGYLICDGQWVKNADYPALKRKVSKVFTNPTEGARRTEEFQLPDFRGRTLVGVVSESCENPENRLGGTFGSETHELTESEMPAHNHNVRDKGHSHTAEDLGHTHSDKGHCHGGNNFACVQDKDAEWKSGFSGGGAFRDNGHSGVSRGKGADTSKADIEKGKANITVSNDKANLAQDTVGGGQAFDICQPSISINYLIKAK